MQNIQLAKRLRELFLNDKWIANTNYQETLNSVSYKEATYLHAKLNTIAALAFHINYYLDGLLRAFETGILDISDQYSFNVGSMSTEHDWHELRSRLLANAERFALAVEQMSETLLHQVFMKEQYGTYERNIEAVLEHSYYHLGQIVLLKKIATAFSQDQSTTT